MQTGDPRPPFRVLCVDDNRDVADSTVLLLRTVGFEARACYGGVAALELIQTFRPSICFIDLNMPGMNGDELAHQLRATPGWRPLLLVAVTAMTDSESRAHIQDAGFDLHFIKPVDPEKLRLM